MKLIIIMIILLLELTIIDLIFDLVNITNFPVKYVSMFIMVMVSTKILFNLSSKLKNS